MHLGSVQIVLFRVIPVNIVNFQLTKGICWIARACGLHTVGTKRMTAEDNG
jgi:hypothetical protein